MANQVLDEEKTLARLQTLMRSEHWLATYVSDLLSAHDLSAGIDFRTAEQLLAAEKEQFEKDLAIARRMLRVYGKQVMAENMAQNAYAPQRLALAQQWRRSRAAAQCSTRDGNPRVRVFPEQRECAFVPPPEDCSSILKVSTGDGKVFRFIFTRAKSWLSS